MLTEGSILRQVGAWRWWVIALLLPLLLYADSTSVDPRAYQLGERLDFDVYLEFVQGGTARMEVAGLEDIDGKPCYHFVSTAISSRTVDRFYKVRDRVESWRDAEGGFTRLYKKVLREGRYRCNKKVEYYPEKSAARMFRKADAEPEALQIKGSVQDVLSALYDVRTRKLKVGEPVFVELHDIDKQYTLQVDVLSRETVEVPAGRFDCIVVEPRLTSAGLFRREGVIQVWLTDDANHMPVLMKSKLYFGRVWAKLTEFYLGGK